MEAHRQNKGDRKMADYNYNPAGPHNRMVILGNEYLCCCCFFNRRNMGKMLLNLPVYNDRGLHSSCWFVF